MARTKHYDAKQAEIIERQRQALELRKSGASLRSIGNSLGVSHIQARNDIEAALELARAEVTEDAIKLRALEVERLDGMLLAIASAVRQGHLGAIDRALRIMERRAKLLGLDMPTKIAPTDPSGESSFTGLIINLDSHSAN